MTAVLATATATACAGAGIERASLPAEPLAFVYRTETQAQERSEMLERAQGRAPKRPGDRATARLEDVGGLFGLGDPDERRVAVLGRMAFFDVQSDEISVADFALPGAVPVDWSPDHDRLLYVSQKSGVPQIYEWRRDTGGVRAITRGPSAHPGACYGPEGQVAYVSATRSRQGLISRIFVSGPGGADPRPVSAGPADGAPAWSPDGSVLLYEVDAHLPGARIAALDPEVGESRVIARGRHPVFTSDGKWVIYSAPLRGGWRIQRMRPDGSGKLPVGTGVREEHAPSVSPDGRFVAYASDIGGQRRQLRVRALDGSGDRPLVSHGDGNAPAWN